MSSFSEHSLAQRQKLKRLPCYNPLWQGFKRDRSEPTLKKSQDTNRASNHFRHHQNCLNLEVQRATKAKSPELQHILFCLKLPETQTPDCDKHQFLRKVSKAIYGTRSLLILTFVPGKLVKTFIINTN